MFKIGDIVVYGGTGVCNVTDIRVPDMEGANAPCYLLVPRYQPGTRIYAPTEGSPVPMRPAMTREEGHALIDSMPELEALPEEDKQTCLKSWRVLLRSGDGEQLARLVKTLHEKRGAKQRENKSFSSVEKDLLSAAQQLLHGELAHVLGLEPGDVEAYIERRLQAA